MGRSANKLYLVVAVLGIAGAAIACTSAPIDSEPVDPDASANDDSGFSEIDGGTPMLDAAEPDSERDAGSDVGGADAARAPECGNGELEGDEVCDDANRDDGDGCAADCATATCLVPITHEDLQTALNDEECPIVFVQPGTYVGNFVIDRALELRGSGSERTRIDGGEAGPVFAIDTPEPIRFADVTIQRGLAQYGGGIQGDDGRLEIVNSVVQDNVALAPEPTESSYVIIAVGGGVYAGGEVVIENSRIINNRVSVSPSIELRDRFRYPWLYGGGVYAEEVTITASEVRGNATIGDADTFEVSVRGGGVWADDRIVVTDGSCICGNRAEGGAVTLSTVEGGGIHAASAEGLITDSRIADNQVIQTGVGTNSVSAVGGGATITWRGLRIERSEFVNNSVQGLLVFGGGLHTFNPDPEFVIVDSTFSGNRAIGLREAYGGALYSRQRVSAVLRRNLFVDNRAEGDRAGGGAVAFQDDISAWVTNCTFSQNRTAYPEGGEWAIGGAMYLFVRRFASSRSATAHIASSTFAFNESRGGEWARGGAFGTLFFDDDVGTVSNSLFVGNLADGDPQWCATFSSSNGEPIARTYPELLSGGGNIAEGFPEGCNLTPSETDSQASDFALPGLADNGGFTETHALAADSPGRDVSTACTDAHGEALEVDQRGAARDETCDVGAYEVDDD